MTGRRRPAVLILIALCILTGVACDRSDRESVSRGQLLEELWRDYKRLYLEPGGNVVDPERNGGETISEAQGYALLRAVWMEDSETFERVFRWTEEHLKRDDGLYSWQWSPREGGRILDANTAGDGDQEIAFALLLAAVRFERGDYAKRAGELLAAIRAHASLEFEGGWLPAGGNWATAERIVNLSYFLPYAYPYFDRVDPEGDWLAALEGGYRLVEGAVAGGERLVPDFAVVSADGSLRPLPEQSLLSGDFSFDAMRVYWRVALDCQLHGRPRACSDPAQTRRMARLYRQQGAIYTRYSLAGEPLERSESLSFYGSLLPAFGQHAPPLASDLVEQRLSPEAIANGLFGESNRYYDHNWVWFGLAADGGLIAERTPGVEVIDRWFAMRSRR